MGKKVNQEHIPDYLTPLLTAAPATWAIIRANEIRALDKIKFIEPVLDIGCGNGFVTQILLSNRGGKFEYGIDLSTSEIKQAKSRRVFKYCKVASVYKLPFKNNAFNMVFSNSVFEHLQDLDLAIAEVSRVLKPNGQLIITVPSSYFTKYLLGVNFFNHLGLKSIAKLYGRFFDKLFNHLNLFTHNEWKTIFKKHSLKLINHYYYHTPKMVQAHEILAYLAIPYHLTKLIFGYWVVFPSIRKLLVVPWLKKILYPLYLDDSKKDEGGSVVLIARKGD